jgi:hypothetical protein
MHRHGGALQANWQSLVRLPHLFHCIPGIPLREDARAHRVKVILSPD